MVEFHQETECALGRMHSAKRRVNDDSRGEEGRGAEEGEMERGGVRHVEKPATQAKGNGPLA